ncbi:MAG: YIP1 family protein, partial [Acidobacteria bacterium]|nr:YIP1 family protein [Acidobacteriota bacterium]
MAPAASPVPAPEPNPLIDVFFSPAAAMDSLARRPRFVLPLLIVTVIGVATMVVAFQRGAVDHFMRQQLEPRLERLTPDQREQAMERMLRFAPYQMVGGTALSPTIGALVISGIFLLIANVMGGGGASFQQMLAVVSHSWLPLSVSSLIGIPILLAKEPDAVDLRNVVMANPSFLFDQAEQHK